MTLHKLIHLGISKCCLCLQFLEFLENVFNDSTLCLNSKIQNVLSKIAFLHYVYKNVQSARLLQLPPLELDF